MQVTSTEALLAAPPAAVAGVTLWGVSLPLLVLWLNFIYIVLLLARFAWKTYKEWKNE